MANVHQQKYHLIESIIPFMDYENIHPFLLCKLFVLTDAQPFKLCRAFCKLKVPSLYFHTKNIIINHVPPPTLTPIENDVEKTWLDYFEKYDTTLPLPLFRDQAKIDLMCLCIAIYDKIYIASCNYSKTYTDVLIACYPMYKDFIMKLHIIFSRLSNPCLSRHKLLIPVLKSTKALEIELLESGNTKCIIVDPAYLQETLPLLPKESYKNIRHCSLSFQDCYLLEMLAKNEQQQHRVVKHDSKKINNNNKQQQQQQQQLTEIDLNDVNTKYTCFYPKRVWPGNANVFKFTFSCVEHLYKNSNNIFFIFK